MSTKVYVAYRLRRNSDLWSFLRDTRVRAEENCRDVLKELYKAQLPDVDTTSDAFKEQLPLYDGDELRVRIGVVRKKIREGYLSQLRSSERDLFDFDVSLTVHEHAGRLYVIPYCDMLMKRVLDFLKQDKRLTDFAYWDNTDQPEEVSARAWKERGRIWDKINDNWDDMLCLDIFNKNRFFRIDPGLGLYKELTEKQEGAVG